MTQSLPYCCSTTTTTFQNWRPKIGQKLIATNQFLTNGRINFIRNYRQWLPSQAQKKTTRQSPEMLVSPCSCSDLKGERCRIWRKRKTWSWVMTSLPLWYNSDRRTKCRNLWIKNSGPCHQRRQGWILLLIHCVLSLHHFLQSSIPQNLGFASKVTTLATHSMIFFADSLLHIQVVFIVAVKQSSTLEVG